MDGIPFRKLANEIGLNPSQTYRKVRKEMKKLPDNIWLTTNYCNRWSGRLNIDGKFVKVRGYKKKIPFIYCIDFLTHDIPIGLLAPSENYQAFYKIFSILRSVRYPLQVVICDEAPAVKAALEHTYPKSKIQLCHNHYLENIRKYLNIRTEEKYQRFFYSLNNSFSEDLSWEERETLLYEIYLKFGKDELVEDIMADIVRRKDELFTFDHILKCPRTNNLIEAYNSHLNARLKSIKGFKSFQTADLWLNAWMVRRRTKSFTDCQKPFKHLNGKCSLEKSLKKGTDFPEILGIKLP